MDGVRLLIVDGDESVRSVIKEKAAAEGFACDEAADGIAAIKLFRRYDYSLILLDTELPQLDGRNVCRQIRKVSDTPIIIVSARSSEEDRLTGFDLGADDYVLKPFSTCELMARVKVFLRRSGGIGRAVPRKISFSGLFIDTVSRSVYVDDRLVQLTPKEYDLLFFLSQNPNEAFSRDVLLNEVWGYDFAGSDRTVDTHIKTLRENIKPYDGYIMTVWGFGYKFVI
ncbi:MAG: response regulator transcription factor [Clostridiales bacterium]|jgi:two-component system response regulator ResD|nr:response regulator transcription factor [Clostridiales bacterium]